MTNEEEKIRLGLADINGIAAMIRDNLTALSQLSSVTKSKAAETDRLTDENRALRRQVEDLEAKLAEHKRLAQEKVDALEELLSKATLPDEESATEPQWVVNSLAELGVRVGRRFFWLYKGNSLEYTALGVGDSGAPIMWRPVGKREFGEVCSPLSYVMHDGRFVAGEGWQTLPLPKDVEAQKAPAVEVMPGPDYVTRAELVDLIRLTLPGNTGDLIVALRTKRFAP